MVFLQTPLLPSTKHMLNADVLPKLKRGMALINTSRGGTTHYFSHKNKNISCTDSLCTWNMRRRTYIYSLQTTAREASRVCGRVFRDLHYAATREQG